MQCDAVLRANVSGLQNIIILFICSVSKSEQLKTNINTYYTFVCRKLIDVSNEAGGATFKAAAAGLYGLAMARLPARDSGHCIGVVNANDITDFLLFIQPLYAFVSSYSSPNVPTPKPETDGGELTGDWL